MFRKGVVAVNIKRKRRAMSMKILVSTVKSPNLPRGKNCINDGICSIIYLACIYIHPGGIVGASRYKS